MRHVHLDEIPPPAVRAVATSARPALLRKRVDRAGAATAPSMAEAVSSPPASAFVEVIVASLRRMRLVKVTVEP